MSKKSHAEKKHHDENLQRIKEQYFLLENEDDRKELIKYLTFDENNRPLISKYLSLQTPHINPTIEFFLEHGMDVNAGEIHTCALTTALISISNAKNRKVVVELLLKYGADMYRNEMHEDGTNYVYPLILLLIKNQLELLDVFINNGYDVNFTDPVGNTFLHIVSKLGNYYFVEKCLDVGFNPMTLNKNGESPYFLATDEKIKSIIGKKVVEMEQINLDAPDMPVVTKRYVKPVF